MRSAFLPAAAVLALGLAAPAAAAPGFATSPAELRAGPGVEYPPVAFIPGGVPVEILGCLQGYDWCDVGYGPSRGWLPAGYLQYVYQNRGLPLVEYGPRFGVPVVGFSLGDYWGHHYRDRPWYAERDRWRGPPPRAEFRGPPPPDWRRDGPPGRGPDWRDGRGPDWRDGRHDGRADWRDDRRGPPPAPGRGPGEGDRGRDGRWDGRGEGRGPDQRGSDHRGSDHRDPDHRGPGDRGPR